METFVLCRGCNSTEGGFAVTDGREASKDCVSFVLEAIGAGAVSP